VLLTGYAEHGKRMLFTGLGGDEARKLRTAERERFGVRAASPLRQRGGAPAFLGPLARRARGSLLADDGYRDADEPAHAATECTPSGQRTFDVNRPLILETGPASLQARR